MTLAISSPAFGNDQRIPAQFSRDGGNVSPPVQWHGAPGNTRSYALIVEDPDAPKGTFRHWAAYDIPRDATNLAQGVGSRQQGAAVQMAVNDFGNPQYDGPQPPPNHGVHHYHFRLFALDVPDLDVAPEDGVEAVLEAARAHALEEAEVIGTFER